MTDIAAVAAPETIGSVAPVLSIEGLSVRFRTEHGTVHALSDVHLAIGAGEVVVLVGESGSGKTVLAHAVLGLLPLNAEVTGVVGFGGRNLLSLADRDLQTVRGRRIALIPQSAGTALNPVRRLGSQLLEWARLRDVSGSDARPRLDQRLGRVGLSFDGVGPRYPHQLSGGTQQRVVNAGTLVSTPDLVIADEPTYGLDASLVDATADQLLAVVEDGSALLVITHDLRLAERLGGRVALLYASHLMELRSSDAFFDRPAHPYGQGLLGALIERGGVPIPGMTPELTALPPGCPFGPRCASVREDCRTGLPAIQPVDGGFARCVLHADR